MAELNYRNGNSAMKKFEISPFSVKVLAVSDITARFRKWMDDHRLKAADVCGPLHVSEQAIHNWRSAGVPARRVPHVENYMATWTDPADNSPSLETLRSEGIQNLVVQPTEEQFRNWTAAFKGSRYETLHDWAVAGLEAFARESENANTLAFPLPSEVDSSNSEEGSSYYLTQRGATAAGGKSSADVFEEEISAGRKYPKDHYALRVLGKSMEPKIPNGSLIVVRAWRDGYPKKGTIVVYNDGEGTTLKVYDTEKREDPDNPGRMGRIPVLRSLNPEFDNVEPMEGGRIDAVFVEILQEG